MAALTNLQFSSQSCWCCREYSLSPLPPQGRILPHSALRFNALCFSSSPPQYSQLKHCGSRRQQRGLGVLCARRPPADSGDESGETSDCNDDGEESGGDCGFGTESELVSTKGRNKFLYLLKSFLRGRWSSSSLALHRVSASTSAEERKFRKLLMKAEDNFFSFVGHLGRYLVTMMSTGVILAIGFQLSGGNSEMNTLIWYSWLGGIIIGTMVGANMVLEEHSKAGPRTVVITGSTRGLGKALAREFLLSGDVVVIASRSPESVEATVRELEGNLQDGINAARTVARRKNLMKARVIGIACDVCKVEDVKRLASFAKNEFGSINIWINNAGINKGFRPLLQFTDEEISQIVSTNLVGSLICTREAIRVMGAQQKGGHIFNMDGAGSGGSSTPLTAV
ncbi:unnamed protein product [Victoria cruziana]